MLLALAVFLLFALFTSAATDTDTWWQLKTGQYILQHHRLPVPDPFAWTTYLGAPSYPGEETTRYFNLTHEWLAQVMLYTSYAPAGFKGLILFRALWLVGFCGIAGLIAFKRTSSYYLAIGAVAACAAIVRNFGMDRPQLITYFFVALTVAILESRRRLWLLPIVLVFWANCHAGFFLGWVVMGCYCLESLYFRYRGKPAADEHRLWITCTAAVLISGLNPNGFNVLRVLAYYRQSALQSQIWEWQPPKYWEVSPFTVLLYGSIALLIANYRKSRPVEWLLLGLFAASALTAYRNLFLIGFWSPIVIATHLPRRDEPKSSPAWLVTIGVACFGLYALTLAVPLLAAALVVACAGLLALQKFPAVAAGLLAVVLAAGSIHEISIGRAFQFREAAWKNPSAAADFLLKHHVKGRIFNTYTQGGYLLWRLWPEQRVFLDGRALNEGVYKDASRIAMNADSTGGKSGEELLKQYGIDVIVMDGFETYGGGAYYLPAALADPAQKEWKLVFQDDHDVIYMRRPPPDIPVIRSIDALAAMERQCVVLVNHGTPLCARGMMDIFGRIGDRVRYQRWAAVLGEHPGAADAFTVQRR